MVESDHMSCVDCARAARTVEGMREAVRRWKAKAQGAKPADLHEDTKIVRESLDNRGVRRLVRETDWPASMPGREVWRCVCDEFGVDSIERIETSKGVWLVHTWEVIESEARA